MSLFHRLWSILRRTRLDDELRQEMETHISLIEDEERARGFSAQQASTRARRRFGNAVVHRERALDALLAVWLETFLQDVAFAWRHLRRRPAFAVSVVLLLALGIGLNLGIFTVINSIVLRVLPLPDPDRLVSVTERSGRFETPTSWPDFLDLRARNHVLDSSAAFTPSADVVFSTGDGVINVRSSSVTREYFSTLGVTPIAGRLFDAAEADVPNGAALVREDFWNAALNADRSFLGKTIGINGRAVTVVGILPRWFRFPADDTVIWLPLKPEGQQASRSWHAFSMVGRLKPAVTVAQAQTDLDAAMQQLAREFPETNRGRRASIRGLQEWSLDSGLRDRLVVLQIAALVLGLMACANVSSLLLARSSARRVEFSVRAALGASRARQLRQCVTETLVLTVLASAVSTSVAWGSVRFLIWLYAEGLPRAAEIAPDWRLVGVATIAVMTIGLGLGLMTGFHQEGPDLERSLRESHRATGSPRAIRTRKVLVMSQVACAVALLSVTGEVLKSFWSLLHVDIGIDRAHLLTVQVNLPAAKYPAGAGVGPFFARLAESLGSQPGVTDAAAINMLPIAEWGFNGMVAVEGLSGQPRGFFAEYRWITPEYFRTMRVPLVRGRLFLPEEIADRQHAAVINETMARRLWNDKDPLGAHVRFLTPEWITVVGVVRDIRQTGLGVPPSPEIFLPANAYLGPSPRWSLVIRSPLPTPSLLASIRRTVQRADPEAAIGRVKTMDEVVMTSVSNQRIVMTLLVAFGVLALALAALGIYSLVAYTVVLRGPEFAVRAALGAAPARLVRRAGREGLTLIATGLIVGVAATFPVGAALATSVFGVQRIDLRVLAAVTATLLITGGLATLVPALRAARIDALRMLRQE